MKKKLRILFEDKYIIIVYKKSGIPTVRNNKCNYSLYEDVYDYLHKKNQKLFIVHRLDTDTSGLVLFAKNEEIKRYFQDNWYDVERNYVCVVHGKTNLDGIIESYIAETKTLLSYSTLNKKIGKKAITKYKLIDGNDLYSLLDISILTGRKNQIRVHMKDNKTPIVGDKKYGIKDFEKVMFLLAYSLKFKHPINKSIVNIQLDIPKLYFDYIKRS